MSLHGKVAIITGAGSGIGRATALRFARDGATVAVADVGADQSEETVKLILAGGGRATAYQVDVSNKASVDAAVGSVLRAYGTVDVLINNAGITRDSTAKKLDEAAWDAVLNVNLKGTFLCCQAVIQTFSDKNYGRIVNTASVAIRGNFGQANYAASKAGVVGLTRTLALELARYRVTVNCIAPGATNTPMVAAIPDQVREKLIAQIPLRRVADPEEIAALHAFLASDDAAYITGQTIFCDGGASIGT